MRRVLLCGSAVAALALLLAGAVRWYYADLLDGPELTTTPAELSLKGEFPPPPGWSEEAVAPVLEFADTLASAAVIVLHDGRVVGEWGATSRRISAHSIRKSLVSALYGIAVDRGLIDISATLADLGVEEIGRPLSGLEQSASLRDLLTARSGIYHASVKDDNGPYPTPGTHRPGEAFVYNNWSFNALGGIFERETDLSLGEAFKGWIADAIGMQDFRIEDVVYTEGSESAFPAYRFWMSARDLARFGQLYLDEGVWNGRQVVPAGWITESVTSYSDTGNGEGYGYMWWIMPDGSYVASGTGGQKLRIYPDKRLVVVNRVDTGDGLTRVLWWNWGDRVRNSDISEIRRRLEDAIPHIVNAGTAGAGG